MKRELKYTDKGYSYVECTPEDCYKWGGSCMCDYCDSDMMFEEKIYLVWVIHSALCEKCFFDWQKRAKKYEEDLYLQKQSDIYYYKAHGLEV